ncbi:hypothetical protein QE152_g22562 [Popillia japonica]|uniref:Uncharacterized protein n=1 Tax=Popillia japonica TaxID=7064 RepID=A0AAW1KIE4_POPJA
MFDRFMEFKDGCVKVEKMTLERFMEFKDGCVKVEKMTLELDARQSLEMQIRWQKAMKRLLNRISWVRPQFPESGSWFS